MRRATLRVALALAATLPLLPPDARAQEQVMNGIGLVDYSRKPTFKIGDWVRYKVEGANDRGDRADYQTTILIAGEERFWGEDCFWVETWTHRPDGTPVRAVATLMSYSIFGDSAAIPRMKLYMRKAISEHDENGIPRQELTKRPPLSLRSRKPPSEHTQWDIDTLGADTVRVPRGEFTCTKVRMKEGVAVTAEKPDSTMRTEVLETRTIFLNGEIPITRIAREAIEQSTRRRVWKVGLSQEGGDWVVSGRSQGDARVLDYGHQLDPQLVPEVYRRTIREQEAATRKPAKTATRRSG